MNAKIELVLRNPTQPNLQTSIFFRLLDLPLAHRWLELLKSALTRPHLLEKNSSFLGFLGGTRNKKLLCQLMNNAADEIRNFTGAPPWDQPYRIDLFCDPEKISFDLLNSFHHHFEILMGGTFEIGAHYKAAPAKIRAAIRQINYAVHELEAIERSERNFREQQKIYPYTVLEILEKSPIRKELELEDYSVFSLAHVFGDLQVAYCQTGKTPYEAWRDKDQEIFNENINGMQFYSANFSVRWGPSSNPERQRTQVIEPFKKWLEEKGADLKNDTFFLDQKGKRHGLGFLTIGKLDLTQFENKEVSAIQKIIANHSDVYKIRVHDESGIVEKTYDYFLNDEYFTKSLLEVLDGFGAHE
jgi:hypothetical protein